MKISVLRFLAAACLAAGAGSAAVAQTADWDKVIAAAKKEGKVAVYHAQLGAPHFLAVVKAFEDKYGISVEQLDLRASELMERIRVEQTSGRPLADVEYPGAATLARQIESGFIQPYGGVPNMRKLRPPFVADEMSISGWAQVYGILVNTNLVKPGEEPKSWPDLLDPKWKGKILSDDVRPIGGGQTMFYVTYKTYGPQFHEKLAAQNLVFSRDLRNDSRRVARGEYPIYIPQMFAFTSDLKGLPVNVIVPTDGSPFVHIKAAMPKGAPHPNAARLFINHLLDIDSQLEYANAWMGTAVEGVAEKLTDPDAKRFAAAKLLGEILPADQQQMMDLATKIYK